MKKTVCIDLDGVLARYDGWKGVEHIGDPLPGAKELVRRLAEKYEVVLWTTRANPHINPKDLEVIEAGYFPDSATLGEVAWKLVDNWLEFHGFPRRWKGEEGGIDRITYMKVPAVAYIDDRAVGVRLNPRWDDPQTEETELVLARVTALAAR